MTNTQLTADEALEAGDALMGEVTALSNDDRRSVLCILTGYDPDAVREGLRILAELKAKMAEVELATPDATRCATRD